MAWTLTPEEQRSLSERLRDGDAEAEAALMRLFWDRVCLMMRARTGDRETARDLAQDVMVAVWQAVRSGQLRDPARLAAFVHGIARNVANNYVRRRAHQPQVEALPEDVASIVAADDTAAADRRAAVRAALDTLGAVDRRILLLTLVDGMKPGEIAAHVGLSPEVVRTRKSRALKKVIAQVRGMSQSVPPPPLA